ncbi:MAG: Mov34/MPN/PAD-1 family protein [Candidatus Sigynarchaeota archaeon]
MPRVHVDHWIEEFIKAHARTSSKEIYGWLVGHETPAGDLLVVSAIACERYTTQHEVGARPDIREIQELASSLPQGIGFVGIYHSHPGEVFHSSTDDETAISMARLYPRLLSAVTNGSKTKWYRHEGGKKLAEFEPSMSLDAGGRIQLIRAEATIEYSVLVDAAKPILPQVSSMLLDGFRAAWPGATIDFCRIMGDGNDAAAMIPAKILSGDTTQALKIEKRVAIRDLPAKNLKFADERMILARVQLHISQSSSAPGTGGKNIAGKLVLDGIIGNVAGTLDAAIFARQLEAELIDDLMAKTGRAIVGGTTGEPAIVPPRTYYLPYLAIPLKLRVQVGAGGTGDAAARERGMVDAMIKRAASMLSSDRIALGRIMVATLRDIASALAEQELVHRCNTLLALAGEMEKNQRS